MAITDKYNIINNTYITKDKKYETEIGDIKQTEFIPQIKVKRWDNESNFSIRLIDAAVDIATVAASDLTESISYDKLATGCQFKWAEREEYREEFNGETVDCIQNHEGGYKFDVVFKEKPKSNVLNFSVLAKDLRFIYQDELHPLHPTWDIRDLGKSTHLLIRPENVVGSYAAYHKTKKNNEYQTGKVFHIYRPKITDNGGKFVWGELNLSLDLAQENGTLSITIPQKFLDDAVYPVTVDPDLGYTTAGGSSETGWNGYGVVNGDTYTTDGSGGTLGDGKAYVSGAVAGCKVNLYNGTGPVDGNAVITNSLATFNAAVAAGWRSAASGGASLSATTDYYVCFTCNSGSISLYYDSGTTCRYNTIAYGSAPQDPFSEDGTWTASEYSIYFEYAAGGSTETISSGAVALADGGATELWANLLVIPTSVTLTKTGGDFWGNLTSTITSGTNTLTGSSFWGNITSKIASGTLTITGAAFSKLGTVIEAIAGGALTLTGKAFNNTLTVKIAKVATSLTGSNLFGNITSKIGAGALAITGVLKLVQTVILTGALTLTGKAFWANLLSVVGSGALTLTGTLGTFIGQIIASGTLTITTSTVNFIRAINLGLGALTITGKNFISNVAGVGGRMLRRFFDFF